MSNLAFQSIGIDDQHQMSTSIVSRLLLFLLGTALSLKQENKSWKGCGSAFVAVCSRQLWIIATRSPPCSSKDHGRSVGNWKPRSLESFLIISVSVGWCKRMIGRDFGTGSSASMGPETKWTTGHRLWTTRKTPAMLKVQGCIVKNQVAWWPQA